MRCVLAAALVAAAAGTAGADVIYNNIPGTLPNSFLSLGYQATSTRELGDRVNFAGSARDLTTATVTLVNWAKQEDYDPSGVTTSFNHPVTFNLYNAGSGSAPGSLIASITNTFAIPYRPTGWATNGYAFNISFDFTSLGVTLPESVVYGVAFNTQTRGYNPIGVAGPYNSLNYGLNDAVGGGITVGANDNLDDVFLNSSSAATYSDGGLGGLNTFRADADWTGYAPLVQFNAVPAPSAVALLGAGGILISRRRRA